MVDIVEQLCIKSCTITTKDGHSFTAKQGKQYTTTVPVRHKDKVTVFSSCWVPLPKDNFVPIED